MASRQQERVAFELERFAWQAPDRLEVSGRFGELNGKTEAAPVLVVRGAEGTHRLAMLPESTTGQPAGGEWWRAAFLWAQAPVPFDGAELELGPGIRIELPEPHSIVPGTGLERLRLDAELIEAREQASELRGTLERAEEEGERLRVDLAREQKRSAANAKRFQEGLDKVKASAEQALASEQAAAQQLSHELRSALAGNEAKDAAIEELRRQIEELREQLDAAAVAQVRAREEAQAELEPIRGAALEAHDEAARLVERLTAIAGALSDQP